MYREEKKKATNYGSIFVYCFFCLVIIGTVVRFAKPYYNPQILMETKAVVKEALLDVEKSGILPYNFKRSSSAFVPPQNHQKLSAEIREEARIRPPVSYSVKFQSFATVSKLVQDNDGKYESRPFSAGGYNWTFLIYPIADKPLGSGGWVSLYVKIDNSSFIDSDKEEVYAWIKFLVFKSTTNTWRETYVTEAQRFDLFKQEYGFINFLEIGYFQNPGDGFIFDGGKSVFGIDIVVANPTAQWEKVSYDENIRDPITNIAIINYSNIDNNNYVTSQPFSSGGKNWKLEVYPNGAGSGMGNSLSLYLLSASNEKGYIKAKLRVIDQIRSNHFERQVTGWPNATKNGWGFDKFIPLADINDASRGFLVNDTINFEVELLSFLKTDSYSI